MFTFERTFDTAAANYEKSRPFYVPQLYRDLFAYQPLQAGSKVLEIGVGTGKATGPILETGCQLTGLEPGEHLAAFAKERFSGCETFDLRLETLQEYESPAEAFDLIYAATAFHWIPEEYGYKRVYQLLKPGGTFARFAYHAGPDQGRGELAAAIQDLYVRYYAGAKPQKEFGEEDAQKLTDLAEYYGFTRTAYKLYRETKDFTADAYLELLTTYPDHMALEPDKRNCLFEGIHKAILQHGGTITVYYTMDLELAQKPE